MGTWFELGATEIVVELGYELVGAGFEYEVDGAGAGGGLWYELCGLAGFGFW